MANSTYTIGSLIESIRKDLSKSSQVINHDVSALYFFCGKKLLKTSDGISTFI
jgi:hypothetical protein